VLVGTGGVSEGPVDQIRGVPVRARKNYFGSADSKKIDPVCGSRPNGRGSAIIFGIRARLRLYISDEED
jgi:hypothetical protein